MSERYVVDQPAAHWYTADGKPCHTLPAKGDTVDGTGLRKVDVRDALRLGLLPSVTNILGVLYKPGLEAWKQNQLVLAALDLYSMTEALGLTDREERAAWIIEKANEPSERGKDIGSRVHKAIDAWLKGGSGWDVAIPVLDDDILPVVEGFKTWYEHSGIECVSSEQAATSNFFGYGGTFDLFGNIPHADEPVPVDWKTQQFDCVCVERGCRLRHPVHYPEWGAQLAAYDVLTLGLNRDGGSASVAISSTVPGLVDLKFYDEDETRQNWLAFLSALRLWYSKLGRGARLPRPPFMVVEEASL